MGRGYVLDASALLASLFDEPGAPIADAALDEAAMSAVNYSEVIAKQIRRGEDAKAAIRNVDNLELFIVPWDANLAREASDLAVLSWTNGLSFGDRACLATARSLKRCVLTAERGWLKLPPLGVEIRVIR
jgi:PIN domain nuclease of toxin-antitoxin system